MTTFSGSPGLLKGALVSFELPSSTPNVNVYQYNPDTLTRIPKSQTTKGDGGLLNDLVSGVARPGVSAGTIQLESGNDAGDLDPENAKSVYGGIGR